MANFNKVILAGNLTRDPQLSVLPSNTQVCEFGMAINRKWRGQDGEMRDETCFVDLRAFGRTAETINKYMSKGKPILVEGRLRYDQWEGKDGQKKSRLTVVVDNFQFIDSGGGGGRGGSSSRGDRNERGNDRGNDYDEMPPVTSGADSADDIPF
ncbi:MAG: single-stranded DNA-binding protein [Phycisphaerales bacterium]|nr:single-stranded DNA-binding protein [Phycisphaerales bacterium]MCB9856839.1 single-stranded DNA-binding protein [Phycisphaerales bacterium]MCB9862034.1 single-stranded DNA-binding protein [Phycisphaerales bacterium]